jgi:hypothetical protein
VHPGDAGAVAGHTDVAHQPLVTGPGQCLDGAAGAVGDLPLARLDQVVELDEVDGVDLEALQRSLELAPGPVALALAGLGGEEETGPVLGHPRPDPQLGIAVAGGRVDVVHAQLEQGGQYLVGAVLAHASEGGGPEDDAGAVVSGAPERCGGQLFAHRYAPYDQDERPSSALRFPIRRPFGR